MADEPPPLRSDPPTQDDIRQLIAWGKRTAAAIAADRQTSSVVTGIRAGRGAGQMPPPPVPYASRTAPAASPAVPGASTAIPDGSSATPVSSSAVQHTSRPAPDALSVANDPSPAEPRFPPAQLDAASDAAPSAPAAVNTTAPVVQGNSTATQETWLDAQEASMAESDAATPELDDGAAYYNEVCLGPLARYLGLIAPEDDSSANQSTFGGQAGAAQAGNQDGPEDDGFIDVSNATLMLVTTATSAGTGAKAAHVPQRSSNSIQQPYLWSLNSPDGRQINLFLNGINVRKGLPRILFAVQQAGSTTRHWVELGKYKDRPSMLKMDDVVIECSFTNYKLIVEAFHLLRQRKAKLVKEWRDTNPGKAHLLRPLPHELADNEIKQTRYEIKTYDKLATFAVTPTGDILRRSYVYRRLVLRRVLPDPENLLEEPRAEYISVNTGEVVTKNKDDVLIPETEQDYARLAAFFAKETARVWQGFGDRDAGMAVTRPALGMGISRRNSARQSFSKANAPSMTKKGNAGDVEKGGKNAENLPPQPATGEVLSKSQRRAKQRGRAKERARDKAKKGAEGQGEGQEEGNA